jgi:hypothetical protein
MSSWRPRKTRVSRPQNPGGETGRPVRSTRTTRARNLATENEYEIILAEVLSLKQDGSDADAKGEDGEDEDGNRVWCICWQKEHIKGSKKMVGCDDLICAVVWYHDICMSPWEIDMSDKYDVWICKACFDTRLAGRARSLKTAAPNRFDRTSRPAAAYSPQVSTKQTSIQPTASATRAARTLEQKMAETDAILLKNNQWFFEGKNEDKDTFSDTETGLRRVPPIIGGGQVSHNFHDDIQERKKVSLEGVACRRTNHLTYADSGSHESVVFCYRHNKM